MNVHKALVGDMASFSGHLKLLNFQGVTGNCGVPGQNGMAVFGTYRRRYY